MNFYKKMIILPGIYLLVGLFLYPVFGLPTQHHLSGKVFAVRSSEPQSAVTGGRWVQPQQGTSGTTTKPAEGGGSNISDIQSKQRETVGQATRAVQQQQERQSQTVREATGR